MNCPRCHAHVDYIQSAQDGQRIKLCSNPACDWEELPRLSDLEALQQQREQELARSELPNPLER